MGVPQLEVPSIGWMVYFLEHPNLKWMITGGTPMTLETFICCIISEAAGLMNSTVEKPSKLLYNWTLRPNI